MFEVTAITLFSGKEEVHMSYDGYTSNDSLVATFEKGREGHSAAFTTNLCKSLHVKSYRWIDHTNSSKVLMVTV